MKIAKFFLLTLLVTPLFAGANYYVSDYDPDYVPYNLQEVIDSLDYNSCVESLRDFDTTYEQYLDLYGTPISIGDTLDVNFGALKESSEENFRQCLKLVRVEIQEESVENCDFETIEAMNQDEERLYRSEIRTCENLRALESCDFRYIDEMDGPEKFKYRVEIDECEIALEPPKEESSIEAKDVAPVPAPEVIAEPDPVEMPSPEPVYEPVSRVQETTIAEPVFELSAAQESEEVQPNESSSTDSETFVMTQEEIDNLVAERVAEQTDTTVQNQQNKNTNTDEKPGFFKRVWSFFFGWL